MQENKFLIKSGLLRLLVASSAQSLLAGVELLKISEPSLENLATTATDSLKDFVAVITDGNPNDAQQLKDVFEEHKVAIFVAGLDYGSHLVDDIKDDKLRALAQNAIRVLTKVAKNEPVPTIQELLKAEIQKMSKEQALQLANDVIAIFHEADLVDVRGEEEVKEDTPPPKE